MVTEFVRGFIGGEPPQKLSFPQCVAPNTMLSRGVLRAAVKYSAHEYPSVPVTAPPPTVAPTAPLYVLPGPKVL